MVNDGDLISVGLDCFICGEGLCARRMNRDGQIQNNGHHIRRYGALIGHKSSPLVQLGVMVLVLTEGKGADVRGLFLLRLHKKL